MGKGQDGVAPRAEMFAVKNTFIQVDDDFFEDEFEASISAIARRRQISEPVFSRTTLRAQADAVDSPPVNSECPILEKDDEPRSDRGSSTAGSVGCEEPEAEQERLEPEMEQECVPAQPMENMAYYWPEESYVGMAAVAPWVPQHTMVWAQPCGQGGMMVAFPMGEQHHIAGERRVSAGEGSELGLGAADAGAPNCCESAIPGPWKQVTTVMMRNLPNRYTQQMLLEEVTDAGFSGSFDFFYLPIDPDTNANKGYAFINFVAPEAAWRFKSKFEGKQVARYNSSKFVSVSPAALQGLEANYAHYSTARCSRGDPAMRPIFLREPGARSGVRSCGSRRRGQRHHGNGRSLVDLAANEQVRRQQQQEQQPPATHARPDGQPMLAQFCPYCGGSVQPAFRFCQFCGAAQCATGSA